MRSALLATLDRHGGVLSRVQALAVVPRHVVDDAVAAGALVVVFRGVYCRRGTQSDRDIRRRAALLAVPGSALSHTDALAVGRVIDEGVLPDGPVHLTVSVSSRHPGRQPGLRVHRRKGVGAAAAFTLTTGHVIVSRERAMVDSWPLLADDVRRSVVIDGVRRGLLSTNRLQHALAATPYATGAAQMRRLVDLLECGCQSELEIWGLTRVFDHPSLPPSVAQRPVRLRGRTVFLDRAYDDVLLGIEMDGAAYHFGRHQRERDMRRDAELAALGWMVLRFSYRRLVGDPDGVRREITEVIATRQSQFGRVVAT